MHLIKQALNLNFVVFIFSILLHFVRDGQIRLGILPDRMISLFGQFL